MIRRSERVGTLHLGRVVATAAVMLGIAGCAVPVIEHAVPIRRAVVLETFELSGRLAVARGGNGFSGGFRWVAAPGYDQIDLTTPLGQTAARLSSAGGRVSLVAADGRTADARSWEVLTARELGWPLPVTGLRYWVQGAPRPGSAYEQEGDELGRVTTMRQDGWQIAYRYLGTDLGTEAAEQRPSGVRLSYQDLEVRLVVDRSE